MASTSSTPSDPSISIHDDTAIRAVNKRYQGLVTVKTKAIKGKGAWYWAHLEPILMKNPDTHLPKAVKLKCCLCEAVFSASNPSRTATEHLKKGTCPNFVSVSRPNSAISPLPISSLPSPPSNNHRKRGSQMGTALKSLALVESNKYCDQVGYINSGFTPKGQDLVLSGGKEDLGALAMLEDSVKRLKSPKASPGPLLNKDQIDSALELLSDWFYEVCGSVSFSSLEHPTFRAFLNQVGLPCLSRRELSGAGLTIARIRDAMFFQVACNGWKSNKCCSGEDNLVKFGVNLPNGTSVFHKAVMTGGGAVSSKYAEEIMWEAVTGICGSGSQRCVGIVSDKYMTEALRNLEIQYQWMVNISCQVQGFVSLIKDFSKELQLFRTVIENCLKLANFVNNASQVRSSFQKYRMQVLDYTGLLRVPWCRCDCVKDFAPVYAMLEDVLSCARVLQMVILDEACKLICAEDPVAREVSAMVQSELIRGMAQDIETERPLIGECLPLWQELKAKVKEWGARFNIAEGQVEKIVEKRFRKNYHPAWSAAFILDPRYLMRDTRKGCDKLITRLASREEAHVALMELMKWRSEGLDPLYAQAVQYKTLGKVAIRLIFLHATSSGFKCNWSCMKWFCIHRNSRAGLERAQKMIFIAAHSKLDKRDLSNEEEKDGELFRMAGCEDDMLNEVFVEAPSV
ncbi:hypothetical protein IMY05_012G0086700 [Salix suchowensis]|nr:hypothetical protein IMY05_012G0086700 [Salix suchowensis]